MKWGQYLLLSILGISFWFFLGFPFANYHESYGWVAQFNTYTISDFIFLAIGHYSSNGPFYSPLGQITAILLYKLFYNSITPFQIFNYCLTVLSFFILILVMKEKKGLSILLAIIGGIYFTGFSYLFHLHGLYYSPLLLLVSLLIYCYEKSFSSHNLLISCIITLLVSLFHPFAIIIFIFYLIGLYIENRKSLSSKYYLLGFSSILTGIIVVIVLVPNQSVNLELITLTDFLKIYQPWDKNVIMSSISVLLSILTIRSINMNFILKNYCSLAIFLLSLLFNSLSVPVIIAWFLSSIIKMSVLKKWMFVFLIIVTFIFPFFIGLVSKHLYFLVVIVCAYTLPIKWAWFESKLHLINGRIYIIISIFFISLLFILKQDIYLPIISNTVQPLLIEKEKTHQLEEIITWVMKSEYRGYNISLVSEYLVSTKSNPKGKLTQRIPTTDYDLNTYLNSIRSHNVQQENQNLLFICFENNFIDNAELIYFVTGEWAGKASVFIPITEEEK